MSNIVFRWISRLLNGCCLVKVFSLFSIEAKKSRSTGRPAKEPAPEETNKSVFVAFLREAGVTLRQNGTSNEIGKHTQFQIQIQNIQGE